MSDLVLHQQIGAPAGRVWKILEDVRRLPELSPSTVGVAGPDRLTRVGDEFSQTVRLASRQFTSTWMVTKFNFERLLVIEGSVLLGIALRHD